MSAVKFTATKSETDTINKIALRATNMRAEYNIENDTLSTMMDIEAVHCNGCPLDLERLLAADDYYFAHDVFGIEQHIDRKTGRLNGLFMPRFATEQVERSA